MATWKTTTALILAGVILAAPLTAAGIVVVKMLYVQDTLGTDVPVPGLPDAIRSRSKTGFATPVGGWLRRASGSDELAAVDFSAASRAWSAASAREPLATSDRNSGTCTNTRAASSSPRARPSSCVLT